MLGDHNLLPGVFPDFFRNFIIRRLHKEAWSASPALDPDDFRMIGVAQDQQRIAGGTLLLRDLLYLGNKRTGRVDDLGAALHELLINCLADAVRPYNDPVARQRLLRRIQYNNTLFLKSADHVRVMDQRSQ